MNPENSPFNDQVSHAPGAADESSIESIDHILEILVSHNHPFIQVGRSAQRWMGSEGVMTNECDMLVRNSQLESIASDLLESGHWGYFNPDPQMSRWALDQTECDADIMLRRIDVENIKGYHFLSLWSETTYHINVDDCPTVEVPDVYPWKCILVEEKWHPALHRGDKWWFGPRLHPETKALDVPEYAKQQSLFTAGLPRGKGPSSTHSIFIPSLPTYLDALIYHMTHYRYSKPGLALISSWQLGNLTRYLYLELPCQKLPLFIELEEYEFMEKYLEEYVRKPRFVYRKTAELELESVRVNDWDPSSFPDWCRKRK